MCTSSIKVALKLAVLVVPVPVVATVAIVVVPSLKATLPLGLKPTTVAVRVTL